MAKWCGEPWECISRISVVRGSKICGLSTNVDGSKNQEVHIEKILEYQTNKCPSMMMISTKSILDDDHHDRMMVMEMIMLRMKVAPEKMLIAN